MGLGTIVALPTTITSCDSDDEEITVAGEENGDCILSPSETAGPFPIKTPTDLVRANIIADRDGIALLITLTILDQSNDCKPLAGVLVDIWHCDSSGDYSEYDNYTDTSFLRGRQMTDDNGQVSFISIYPGWYRGRAPHIHLEVLSSNEQSILVSQIAFPEDISETVYATSAYNGSADTTNASDNIFRDSLEGNMGEISGNNEDGYTLLHTIIVNTN